MSYNKPIRRIAIVGAGVIGASWAAEYLARGFDVITTDPGPNAEANLRKYIDEAWKDLTNIGLSKGASRDRLTFTTDMKEALSKADFVQENGPERPDFKMKLFAQMDDVAPIDSIIASSSSGITPSVMQSQSKHPERILVGHPFQSSTHHPISGSCRRNEDIAGSDSTSARVLRLDWEESDPFEKGTSRSRREPAAGRALQGDHVSDSARCAERRRRGRSRELWAGAALGSDGPSLQWHLGGGAGGIKHFMDHLMDPLTAMIKTLGTPDVTPELKQTIVEGVLREAGNRSVDELAQQENELIIGLLRSRAQSENRTTKTKQAAA